MLLHFTLHQIALHNMASVIVKKTPFFRYTNQGIDTENLAKSMSELRSLLIGIFKDGRCFTNTGITCHLMSLHHVTSQCTTSHGMASRYAGLHQIAFNGRDASFKGLKYYEFK